MNQQQKQQKALKLAKQLQGLTPNEVIEVLEYAKACLWQNARLKPGKGKKE